MKTTVTQEQFVRKFQTSSYKDNFTYEALNALYNFLIEREKATGQEVVFDIAAICRDFCQLDDEEDIIYARTEGAIIAELSDGTALAYNI